MANAKPFVKMACLCEKVLTEKDGVQTIVRVVDSFFIQPIPAKVLEMGATPQVELTLVVALSANGNVGKHDLGIQLFGPKSAQEPNHLTIELLPGSMSAINAVVNVQ